tara:strand:+ start:284 stop:436 length:153 start_codon:yes stop_codon:yes gene_type:complete
MYTVSGKDGGEKGGDDGGKYGGEYGDTGGDRGGMLFKIVKFKFSAHPDHV